MLSRELLLELLQAIGEHMGKTDVTRLPEHLKQHHTSLWLYGEKN